MKVIFLDVDGVLNNRNNRSGVTFNTENIAALNELVRRTRSYLVLSSTMRHMIGVKYLMDLSAFSYLLRTHGYLGSTLAGYTPHDSKELPYGKRALQCLAWLEEHPHFTKTLALDDNHFDFEEANFPHLKVDPHCGLTMLNVEEAEDLFRSDCTNYPFKVQSKVPLKIYG